MRSSSSARCGRKYPVGDNICTLTPLPNHGICMCLLLILCDYCILLGFWSIDCGSSSDRRYTDPSTGIVWTPDAVIWPKIGYWSGIVRVKAPTNTTNQIQYSTLRYFRPTRVMDRSKFYYSLPAVGGSYYLIRASFWYGLPEASSAALYRKSPIRFRVIVDAYQGVEVMIELPQTEPWFEEMYVRAQSGSSSVSMCLSMERDTGSDMPFINSIELRPLPSTMRVVQTMINNVQYYPMRTVDRQDMGTRSPIDPPVLRSVTNDRFYCCTDFICYTPTHNHKEIWTLRHPNHFS